MTKYVEFTLADGTAVLLQARDSRELVGPQDASGKPEDVVKKATVTFEQALVPAKRLAAALREQLKDLTDVEETEVKFGITATGELGFNAQLAVGTVGMEANFEITLKWKKVVSTG